MAIIVEDGSIVANANSYVSEADLITYAAARGVTIASLDAEELLIKAMDYIESLSFIGIKLTPDQPLQWPRSDVYIDGYYQSSEDLPNELIKGLNETAISIQNGQDPLADLERLKKSVKVGSLAVEYVDGSSGNTVVKISQSLQKILVNGVGGLSFNVLRG